MLGGGSDGNKREQVAPFSDFRPSIQNYVGFDDRVLADPHMGPD
jgi:hypothetical protein